MKKHTQRIEACNFRNLITLSYICVNNPSIIYPIVHIQVVYLMRITKDHKRNMSQLAG